MIAERKKCETRAATAVELAADVRERSEQPTALQNATARRSATVRRVPFRNERAQPLEILARLNGRGSFQLRVHSGKDKRVITIMRDGVARKMIARPAGIKREDWVPPFRILDGIPPPTRAAGTRSSASVRDPEAPDDNDLRLACGFADDKIGSDLAMAIATGHIDFSSRDRIRQEMFHRTQEAMHGRNNAKRNHCLAYCLRVIIWDVFHDLVQLRGRDMKTSAESLKMPIRLYVRIYRTAEGCALSAANEAADEILTALRGRD